MIRLALTVFLITLYGYPMAYAQADRQVTHTVFLIGDAGEPYVEGDPIGDVLRRYIAAAGANTSVLFLGDNVYPKGLAFEGHRLRKQGEDVLANQYSYVRDFPVKAYFIPGNHDWHHWGRKGYEYVLNQQKWIDSLKDSRVTIMPRDGCPGPVEVSLDERNTLVFIDTQWILHQWDKPGDEGTCDFKTTADVLNQLNDILERNAGKRVMIAAHHPLITYGEHGGVFKFKAHIFPLEEISDHLYIPLPLLGSIYPLYRKYFGHIQDTQHPLYKEFAVAIMAMMSKHPGTVYVAGHEHALQHIVKDNAHYIVSGSGAKVEYVKDKNYALYANAVRGFAKIENFSDGSSRLVFVQADNIYPGGKEIYSTQLPPVDQEQDKNAESAIKTIGEKVSVNASNLYHANNAKEFFLGKNYRREWHQQIEIPVFDIGQEKGGLKILQRGGGQQTISLRLQDSAGHEYVIRSVEKFPVNAVPEVLRKTFAQDLVQDQISASHPYAALVIPPLAEAAGIYHTNPKLFYVPDDPRFGQYRKVVGQSVVMFEERPAGDWSHASNFGNSAKIVNTGKVLEKIYDDNDNYVDQQFVLKSRLFDLVIGDWDRHDDQWRWASFKEKKGEMFRPIPRDRDQAFFVNEGKLSKLWSRRWALPKFEGFDEHVDWAPGLSFNARYFDRTFLNELSIGQWKETSRKLKADLSDSAIENSIRKWPKEIYELHGQSIVDNLKKRRDAIEVTALSLYTFLSREVDITGSDKRELFEVRNTEKSKVNLTVYKLNKDGEKGRKVFERVFDDGITKEIRLYGMGGSDRFVHEGNESSRIRVRIIGGAGDDTVRNNSRSGAVLYYDQYGQGTIIGGNVRDKRSHSDEVNDYDRKSFQYNRLAPLLYGNYNPDDGIFFGGGFVAFNHGFRKKPFRQRHIFLASFAPLTLSYNFRYQARFTEAIAKWDVDLDLNVKSPNYVNNFFGMGNESVYDDDIEDAPGVDIDDAIDFYRYRFEELQFNPSLVRKFSNWGSFRIGPSIQRIEMEEPSSDQERFIKTYASTLDYDLFSEYHLFGGLSWQGGIEVVDDPKITTRGVRLNIAGRNMRGIDKHTNSFSSYESSLAFYHRFRVPNRVMLAFRTGGGINTGSFEFYQAQVLDGRTELRGFRKTRFYGDSKFFANSEVRVQLTKFRSYLFPATLGILAFHDFGRVWYKDERGNDPSAADGTSSVWHRGVGGGIWFTPFNAAVLSLEFAHSKDGTLGYLRLGFLF